MPDENCKKCGGIGEYYDNFIPIAGGSMGLGLPGAVGLALAKKLKGEDGKVYVLMSDGELAIGTTWESILIARHHKLDNLVVIIDNNELQAMGNMKDILPIHPFYRMAQDYGWDTYSTSGHYFNPVNINEPGVIRVWSSRDGLWHGGDHIENVVFEYHKKDKPKLVMFSTIKGKGVSFMENNNLFHYKAPNEEEYRKALEELNAL